MRKKQLRPKRKLISPKNCVFCDEKTEPRFSEVEQLQKLLTERGKIIGRSRSGVCAMHQRHLTSAIKYARHLALLPFISRE